MSETYHFHKKLHSCDLLVPYKHKLRDFKNALWLTWRYLKLPEPTARQLEMADRLQHGPDRDMIQAFRGVGKSWITVAFGNWCHLLNPEMKIEVVSASQSLASNFTKFSQQLINADPHDFGIFADLMARHDQRRSSEEYDVGPAGPSKDPSMRSVGITGQITGTRADLLVADDVEVPKTSDTPAARGKLAEAIKEFDAILKPGGKIIYLGTPQNAQSVYNELPRRGYSRFVIPALVPSKEEGAKYGSYLAPGVRSLMETDKEGTTTDPQRFSDDDLSKRRQSYGNSGFRLQFMLDTSLNDESRYPLRMSDFVVMDLDKELGPAKVVWASGPDQRIQRLDGILSCRDGDACYRPMHVAPEMLPWRGTCLYVDPSGTGKDELSYSVTKMLFGYIGVHRVRGLQGGFRDNNLMEIAQAALEYKANVVVIEENFGQGMLGELLKPFLHRVGHPCTVELVRSNKQKELRIIDTLEPALNQHRVLLDPSVIEEDYRTIQRYGGDEQRGYSLVHQLCYVEKEPKCLPHDDRLEALSGGVGYWWEKMAQDAHRKLDDHNRALEDDAIKDFLRRANQRIRPKGVLRSRPI